ncbi:MAG: helix-turn-helix domain-containing protein [Alphaproteobacteria bacterium]|nr:MAG: helix-turn-helix domain-containing protein [Alphaproteobacteria bacterium]
MSYAIDSIATELRRARNAQGLSQRALAAKAGIPQGHISNIEHGTVDLRVSSLIEIARTLGLELVLVPQKSLPAVESVVRSSTQIETRKEIEDIQFQAKKLLTTIQHAVPQLPKVKVPTSEIEKFQIDVARIPLGKFSRDDVKALQRIHSHLTRVKNRPENIGELNRAFLEMANLRNKMVHADETPQEDKVPALPAYRLE